MIRMRLPAEPPKLPAAAEDELTRLEEKIARGDPLGTGDF